ncbi:MAG: helix-turn-helix domain-containing protein, partial [Actinomycetota bacterium]
MRYKKPRNTRQAARLLREARVAAGLTQTQLADLAGMSQPVIAAYESGSREPTVPMLNRMIAASGNTLVLRFEPDSDRYRISDLAVDIRRERDESRRLRLVFEF